MKALVTGIGGQDGWYLTRELEAHGRTVIGWTHRGSAGEGNCGNDAPLPIDYQNSQALFRELDEIQPDEIYHLASPSCIRDTLEFEHAVLSINVQTTLFFLRWIVERSPHTRFFFAGSSEVFGDPVESPQTADTLVRPENPYAVAKLTGGRLCDVFRSRKGVFASVGILYNHESPRRRTDFVSRRITQGVAAIVVGRQDKLPLGNLDAVRDWSHAADFARAFRLALEAPVPTDYLLASGIGRTVRAFCETAFAEVGLDYHNHVVVDERAFRPDFVRPRVGCAARAESRLGWKVETAFAAMVREMVSHDLALERGGAGR